MFLATLLTVAILSNPVESRSFAVAAPPKSAAQKSKPAAKKLKPAAKSSKPATKNKSSTRRSGGSAADRKSPRAAGKSAPTARKSKKSTAVSRPARKPRLPRHFAQLELEDAQRQEVLEIQGRFAERIAKLRQQIAQAQAERYEQLDATLEPVQKRRLKKLRSAKNAREK